MLEFLYFSMKIWRSSNKLIRSQISGCLVCGRKCDMAQIKTKSSVLEIWELPRVFPVPIKPFIIFEEETKKIWPELLLQHSSSHIWVVCFDYMYFEIGCCQHTVTVWLLLLNCSLCTAISMITQYLQIKKGWYRSWWFVWLQILSMAFFRSSLCSNSSELGSL